VTQVGCSPCEIQADEDSSTCAFTTGSLIDGTVVKTIILRLHVLHFAYWWFSPGTPASSTTKTGRHDIAEILLKVALKHQQSIKINQSFSL
jgi:hypothetical protein